MKRRDFLKKSSIAAGAGLLLPLGLSASEKIKKSTPSKTAKNIIFLVSDGMSSGTLNMADLLHQSLHGKHSNWIQLYQDKKVVRALMDTASANSLVTDSAAASSAWGGGVRVNNNSVNVGPSGEEYLPILQKFKAKGKSVGCVTTVPITHATPAGFCVNHPNRKEQDKIAEKYLPLKFDVLLGGGSQYFTTEGRPDKKNVLQQFKDNNYQVFLNRKELLDYQLNPPAIQAVQPILGLFAEDALPYSVDYNQDAVLQSSVPTLAEITQFALHKLQANPNGFVLQIEGGKVDWAAHGNDLPGLLYDQLAFDKAVQIAVDFAEKQEDTLVIITTDHGNGNPGLIYGPQADSNFASLLNYKSSNGQILESLNSGFTPKQVQELIQSKQGWLMDEKTAIELLLPYQKLSPSDIKNYRNLPFELFAQAQKKSTSVGWISSEHSADFVELAALGPGSELLPPFVKNTDLHELMLKAANM